ncbi:MAG: TRAP transporter large permease subunit [Methylocystaceae bacterium]|nr:TRAP transporter large permease subunit [Methylocystaceae bacterium]
MFASFIFLLFSGFPVAFILGGLGFFFAILGEILPIELESVADFTFMGFATDRIFSVASSYSLVPMAMFVFMGYMLEKSGVAERLLDSLATALRKIPGSLFLAIVVIGVILAASTGIIGASVVLLSTVALPAIVKHNFNIPLGLGSIAASGCLGILIPPSIMLIVIGDQLQLSIGDLFMAAIFPGILLSSLYSIYLITKTAFNHDLAPSLPQSEKSYLELLLSLLRSILPPGLLILSVLGSIFFGIASPSEASGIGALGATILALIEKKLDFNILKEVCLSTAKTAAFLYMLIFGAACFSVVLRGYGGDEIIEEGLRGLPFSNTGVLLFLLLTIFLLGFILDWMEIILIIAPLTVPVVIDFGFDPIWIAILIAMILQTSFLTPPVGAALFYIRSTSPPDIPSKHIYSGVLPFVLLQVVGVAIVWSFPEIATWLPEQTR